MVLSVIVVPIRWQFPDRLWYCQSFKFNAFVISFEILKAKERTKRHRSEMIVVPLILTRCGVGGWVCVFSPGRVQCCCKIKMAFYEFRKRVVQRLSSDCPSDFSSALLRCSLKFLSRCNIDSWPSEIYFHARAGIWEISGSNNNNVICESGGNFTELL